MSKLSRLIANTINGTVLLRDQPLAWKLFIFSAIMIIVPMVIVGMVSYERSSAVLR